MLKTLGKCAMYISVLLLFFSACFVSYHVGIDIADASVVPVVMDESGMIISGNGTGTYVEEFAPYRYKTTEASTSPTLSVVLNTFLQKISESRILIGVTVAVFVFAVVCLILNRRLCV